MGNNKSDVINPNIPASQKPNNNAYNTNNAYNANSANSANNSKGETQQALMIIREAFKNCAVNGTLTKDKFNQSLSILEALGFKRLRDTPLADRLFTIFDRTRTGHISDDQLIQGIGQIISDRENAVNYTFMAYDRDGDKMISKKQFMLFIQESWRAAFRLLSEDLDSKDYGVRIKDIESWTNSKIAVLNENSASIFNSLSNGADTIDFIKFKQFTLNNNYNDIVAELDMRKVIVPLNLTNLHL